MELKNYQRTVINDLSRFLKLLTEQPTIEKAYQTLWAEKNVPIGLNGMPNYQSNLKGVPEVCLKVPTGGGKTFIAANAIKPIFESLPLSHAKAVVWLVPSDAILTQTYAALSNPDHPYRMKLDVHFSSAVEVYSKSQLLNGQNFNPTSVSEQLSIFVLSYDSFRTSKKDGRKAFQENGNLAPFARMTTDKSMFLADTDETALIQVIRSLNPVVIVDESHHATSSLSLDMLRNFNPCFVLDLTATPKENSNIISCVNAAQLKASNMVKLPVIVYNRRSQEDVFNNAINFRRELEKQAKQEQEKSKNYIRPIVLFQAQPKNSEDSTTYQKIRETLIDIGIPESEIAIKTGDKDELKNVNLLSPDCPIRYIITVNALKEGWDCPFAYILATVANRNSPVDVEQILGRILRLPHTHRNESELLNYSYVITSSAQFNETLSKVVAGLNNAGFSRKDYRAKDLEDTTTQPFFPRIEQMQMQEIDDVPEVNVSELRERIEEASTRDSFSVETTDNDEMFSTALAQGRDYENNITQEADDTAVPQEVRDKMNCFYMNDCFKDEVSGLRIPQFVIEKELSMFYPNSFDLLTNEVLSENFTLKDKDAQIDFTNLDVEMARVDTDDKSDSAAKAWKIAEKDSAYLKKYIDMRPADRKLDTCKGFIKNMISKINNIDDKELDGYIERVLSTLTEDQISDLEQSPAAYASKIKEKVISLLTEYRFKTFNLWLEQGRIRCEGQYMFPASISPAKFCSTYSKSLYSSEEDIDDYEKKVILNLTDLENIKWWHRNSSRTGFSLNGPVTAYPDFIVMTSSGKLLLLEPKGDHLENEESRIKAEIGNQWAAHAGNNYRYFMIFQTKSPSFPGAYSLDRFMEIVKGL